MQVASAFDKAGLLSPQGRAGQDVLTPATRPASLDGRRVLLIDNKKLGADYGPYIAFWDALAEKLPTTQWTRWAGDLTKLFPDDVAPLAAELAAGGPYDAAILALADVGVSQNTGLLALALERLGIPTVILATTVGARFLRGLFRALAPGLDVVAFDTMRTDTVARVHALIHDNLESILARLTLTGGAAAEIPSDEAPPLPANDWNAAGDAVHAFQDWAERAQLGDGLPLLPPTRRAVDALLACTDEDPDTVLFGPADTSGRTLRIIDAAANAAMTGCPPRAFPVVIAAIRAMALPGYRMAWSAITTHPAGNAVVFSGPGGDALGLTGAAGCLGPGYRGNASVGRAVSLCVSSLFGARPGEVDLTAFGSPAEFTYCMAENIAESPWPSLADEIGGGKPGVFVMKAEGPRNILEGRALTPEGLIDAFAGTATGIGSNNSYLPGDMLVAINPEHARIFADAGWARGDVAMALYEKARIPLSKIEGHGIRGTRPKFADNLDPAPVLRTAADAHIIVAGGAGPQSLVALPWGFSRGQWHSLGKP